MCLKNICDGVGGQDESNGTPLDPPLFWLDNIFKFNRNKKNKRAGPTLIHMEATSKTPKKIKANESQILQ
jgi:hypothetical protein